MYFPFNLHSGEVQLLYPFYKQGKWGSNNELGLNIYLVEKPQVVVHSGPKAL